MQSYKTSSVINDLKKLANSTKAETVQRFFKTGKGEYGHGDIFWGIAVPEVRKIARIHKDLDIKQLELLISHEVHEVRLCTLLIMVFQAKKNPEPLFNLYLHNTRFINNWDLVDLSAPVIVGQFLCDKDPALLYKLAKSSVLWERRIAMIATYAFIKQGCSEPTLKIAQMLLSDKHDLIHKAVGWMLREVGKRCAVTVLESFLEEYAATMPRTALRYAIEHMQPEQKKYFMQMKSKKS